MKLLKPILREDRGWELELIKIRTERHKSLCVKNRDSYEYSSPDDFLVGVKDFTWSEKDGPMMVIEDQPGMRLFPDKDRLMICSTLKKFLYVFLEEFSVVATWWEKLGLILGIKRLSATLFESTQRGLAGHIIEDRFLTPPVKEIKRVLDIIIQGPWEGYYSEPITIILEADIAYRYRFQDIVVEIDKQRLVFDTKRYLRGIFGLIWYITIGNDRYLFKSVKELRRVIQLLIDRELNSNQKFKALKELCLVLQISPYYRKLIIDFFLKLDIEKVKLNYEDSYWLSKYKDYNLGGLDYEQRKKLRKEKYQNAISNE